MSKKYVAVSVPSENWDDDYEFHQNASPSSRSTDHRRAHPSVPVDHPRISSVASHRTEDWDVDMHSPPPVHAVLQDKINHPLNLPDWEEPGPSTPTLQRAKHPDNWDEDFEISPCRNSNRRRRSIRSKSPPDADPGTNNWDEDVPSRSRSLQDSPPKRRRHSPCSSYSSDDDDADLEIADADEGDHTVTSRDRPALLRAKLPQPIIPALQLSHDTDPAPFPGSPAISVFSNTHSSTTGRESAAQLYSSTTHLRSLTGQSDAWSGLPPDPPIHRERRRLRKKSRPPRLDDNIIELDDLSCTPPPPSLPSSRPAPPRPSTPPLAPPDDVLVSPNKTLLLSRIGSVKNWASRRKRSSTNAAENVPATTDDASTSAAPVAAPATQAHPRGLWFFRTNEASASGAAPDVTATTQAVEDDAPETFSKLVRRKSSGLFPRGSGRDGGDGPRRPTPLQTSPLVPFRGVSCPSEAGTMQELADAPPLTPLEGTRRFLGSVRRISFGAGKRHARAKSTVECSHEKDPPGQERSQPIKVPSPRRTAGFVPSRSAPMNSDIGTTSAPEHVLLSPVASSSGKVSQTPSPLSASLGRATHLPTPVGPVVRRCSLGDLKIPARIVQAQNALKKDLDMVKEFAACIEELKDLQVTYRSLVAEFQEKSDVLQALPHSASPAPSGGISILASRRRSNTNPLPAPQHAPKPISIAFSVIDAKYKISWECAELLIELGGTGSTSAPSSNASSPVARQSPSLGERAPSRGSAVTPADGESHSQTLSTPSGQHPPHCATPTETRTGSNGRREFSHRQLMLLREMLECNIVHGDGHLSSEMKGAIDRDWRWNDAMNSSFTLPSDSSPGESPMKERRENRLGMQGLRDMLRMLTRSYKSPDVDDGPHVAHPGGSQKQQYLHPNSLPLPHQSLNEVPHASTRSTEVPNSPYNKPVLDPVSKFSPRRPSIASIFRLGNRNRSAASAARTTDDSSGVPSTSTSASSSRGAFEEDDWDRMEDANDLNAAPPPKFGGIDLVGSAASTVRGRGRSPYRQDAWRQSLPIQGAHSASVSADRLVSLTVHRQTRLSDVEEHADQQLSPASRLRIENPGSPLRRLSNKRNKTQSIRSASAVIDPHSLQDAAVAMTPANIRPLLGNAREVTAQCLGCIAEVRELLGVSHI